MYNHGHSATYKYKGTAQYKIQLQNKIQVDPTKRKNPKRGEDTRLIIENVANLGTPKTRASAILY